MNRDAEGLRYDHSSRGRVMNYECRGTIQEMRIDPVSYCHRGGRGALDCGGLGIGDPQFLLVECMHLFGYCHIAIDYISPFISDDNFLFGLPSRKIRWFNERGT